MIVTNHLLTNRLSFPPRRDAPAQSATDSARVKNPPPPPPTILTPPPPPAHTKVHLLHSTKVCLQFRARALSKTPDRGRATKGNPSAGTCVTCPLGRGTGFEKTAECGWRISPLPPPSPLLLHPSRTPSTLSPHHRPINQSMARIGSGGGGDVLQDRLRAEGGKANPFEGGEKIWAGQTLSQGMGPTVTCTIISLPAHFRIHLQADWLQEWHESTGSRILAEFFQSAVGLLLFKAKHAPNYTIHFPPGI